MQWNSHYRTKTNTWLQAHIEDIVVLKEWRNKGLAQELVKNLQTITINANCYKVIMDCHENLETFYEKTGFKKREFKCIFIFRHISIYTYSKIPKGMSNRKQEYNEKTDFVIPLHRYHYMVRTVVEAIHLFYSPRIIYIITPKRFSTIIEKSSETWLVNKIVVIPEETFFMDYYKLHYSDIQNMFMQTPDDKSREFGWWYQQILKLGAKTQIKDLSDPYIVWDSDLIPLIKWDIYPTKENPCFKIAILQEKARTEWNNEQYRSSMFELTNMNMTDPEEGTFVPHHFVFYHDILNSLLNHIEEISNTSWIKSIISISHKYYRFSEYRTVATFMQTQYPTIIKYHGFKEYGLYGMRIREPANFLNEMHDFFVELYDFSYNFLDKIINSSNFIFF